MTPVHPLLYYLRIRLIQNKTDGQIGPPSVLSELLLYADINEESFQKNVSFFFSCKVFAARRFERNSGLLKLIISCPSLCVFTQNYLVENPL